MVRYGSGPTTEEDHVMSTLEAPEPPRLSPDGRFYWDGSRWAPISQSVNVQRTPYQKVVLALALLALIVIVVGVAFTR